MPDAPPSEAIVDDTRSTPEGGLANDDEAERYRRARQMIADAIESHVGQAGARLLAPLEQTASVHDLHALVPDFAKALVKRVGLEPATPIISSIERLITGK